ncbi:MAG: hypothetical protein IH940_09675, partial [Acidobacteria bacterium]|nr:hypothetical protein [Acidobacteriota bacterium]
MSDAATRRKQEACEAIDAMRDMLLAVSHDIWEHPELCFDEHYAHDRLAAELEAAGLEVTRSAYGLDTAFEATAGTSGPIVAVSDWMRAVPEQIRPWVPNSYVTLGTDGFGFSDTVPEGRAIGTE